MIGSVHAILLAHDKYVLQLRDDKPTIACPGQWSLFGGVIEESETPETGMVREIQEELAITVEDCRFLWTAEYYSAFLKDDVLFYYFEADITHLWGQHRLGEGQDVDCFGFDQLAGLSIPPFFRETIETYHIKTKGTKTVQKDFPKATAKKRGGIGPFSIAF